jgi:DnaJ-class molecular chaperone
MSGAAVGARPYARGNALARRAGRHTHYDVLQVSARADETVIQAAFRTLARTYHPDLNRDAEAPERMREINDAYRVLSDARRRAVYDLELNQRRSLHEPDEGPAIPAHPRPACSHADHLLDSSFRRLWADLRRLIPSGSRGSERDIYDRPQLVCRAREAAGWFTAGLILLAWFLSRSVGL